MSAKRKVKRKVENKAWNPNLSYPIRLTLPGYNTPSLNTMLGRNFWILTKLKKEARDALVSALRSPGTVAAPSTSITAQEAANRS